VAIAYFLDSSAILKRYLAEQGSHYVSTLPPDPNSLLYIVQIAGVEVVSAIARQRAGKIISKDKAHAAIVQFRTDFARRYIVLKHSDRLIERAMQLAETHALRAYDSVQLAAALSLVGRVAGLAVTFVCADKQLNVVAQQEGLLVSDPNLYP
jgi:predicted nucleic acid-binding protein